MYEDIFVSPTEDNQVEFIAGDKSFGYYDSYIVYLSKSVAIQFAKDLEALKGKPTVSSSRQPWRIRSHARRVTTV